MRNASNILITILVIILVWVVLDKIPSSNGWKVKYEIGEPEPFEEERPFIEDGETIIFDQDCDEPSSMTMGLKILRVDSDTDWIVAENEYHHLALVFDGEDSALYMDGERSDL